MRPLNPDGIWQYKTQKEYLCIRGKEERGFTAEEFKTAQAEGWEKQYQYRVGRKKVYLPPSRAGNYERISKTPKSTRFGRQNPISARWNSDEQLVLWREAWADTVNRHLERMGMTARIDHRSHAARGIPELPTVHEGIAARTMEHKGCTADRCELNRRIKADNAFLRELRRQMERITALAEELEDLRTEKNRILASFDLTDDKDMADIRHWIKQQEATIQTLNAQESRCQTELNTALEEYKTLSAHAANFDPQALWPERLRERESLTAEARAELKTRLGADYSERRLEYAEQRLREMLPEEGRELQQYWREKRQLELDTHQRQKNQIKDVVR